MEVNRNEVIYPDEDGQKCKYVLDHESQTWRTHRGGSPSSARTSPTTKRTSPRRERKSVLLGLNPFQFDAGRFSLLLILVLCVLLISYQFVVNVYVFNYMDHTKVSFQFNRFEAHNISEILDDAVVNHGYKKSGIGNLENKSYKKSGHGPGDLENKMIIDPGNHKESRPEIIVSTRSFQVTQGLNTLTTNSEIDKQSTQFSEPSVEPETSRSPGNLTSHCLPKNSSLPPCPPIPARLVGRLKVDLETPSWSDIANVTPGLRPGGEFSPSSCLAKDRVAVVLPYRNRPDQLKTFLKHIHPILMRQDIHYQIFIVNQSGTNTFNRAMLLNVGFVEASKMCDWDCVVFHDVDLLPEDDRNLYTCPQQPRHLSVAVNTMDYKLPYTKLFGGASVLTTEQFQLVNGFSNQFWGWGGEDDNMSDRILHHNLEITRYSGNITRYTMIPHQHEATNKANPHRWKLLKNAQKYQDRDGLNNLQYTLISKELEDFYTNITVIIDKVPLAEVNVTAMSG